MCSFLRPSAPTIQASAAPKKKPEVLHNPFLDDDGRSTRLVKALRTGRTDLRIKMPGEDSIGFGGLASGAARRGAVGAPSGNLQIGAGARNRGVANDRVAGLNARAAQIAATGLTGPERRRAAREDRPDE